MSSPTIVVTEPEFRRAPEVFTSTPDATFVPVPHAEAELSEAVREHRARHVVLGPMPYTGRLYETLPRGGVLARYGVGHDGIDKALATKAGLYCTNIR